MSRTFATLGGACLLLAAVGCTPSRVDQQPSAYSATMARPVNPDVYPVIEGARPAATAQMSNDEAASLGAHLSALSSARASGAISEAEYQRRRAELQALAANHGTDTLKQIQN